jgi:hypothetical protein
MKRLIRKANELFEDTFIETLVEDKMTKSEEYAKVTDAEPQTRDYPGAPEYLEVSYRGTIDLDQLSEEQKAGVQQLVSNPYFKEMLQRDLFYTLKNKSGADHEDVENFDTAEFDKANVEIKVEGNQIVADVDYAG